MKVRLTVLALLCLVAAQPASARQSLDQRLRARLDDLLLTYRDFKGYSEKTAADVEKKLSDDRRAVLMAIARASFIPLTPRTRGSGIPAGARFIDYISAVHGIWGVRPGDDDGKNQFRLSVRLKPETRAHLERAQEFPDGDFAGIGCHVLLPEMKGGDDLPSFAGPFRRADDPKCRRTIEHRLPRMQVSYRAGDPTIGEIDLDFDEGGCHLQPANSDGRHLTGPHFGLLDQSYSYFMAPFRPACELKRFHCGDTYADPNCP